MMICLYYNYLMIIYMFMIDMFMMVDKGSWLGKKT